MGECVSILSKVFHRVILVSTLKNDIINSFYSLEEKKSQNYPKSYIEKVRECFASFNLELKLKLFKAFFPTVYVNAKCTRHETNLFSS